MSKCYVCKVRDPNEIHYDPELHHICMICGAKLWELAQFDTKLDLRDQVISVSYEDPKRQHARSRKVVLTTGYEVDVAQEEGLEHLFSAVLGEVMTRLKETEAVSDRFWATVYDVCICELHYIAGQLLHLGSGMHIGFLLDEFGVQWDRISEKLR